MASPASRDLDNFIPSGHEFPCLHVLRTHIIKTRQACFSKMDQQDQWYDDASSEHTPNFLFSLHTPFRLFVDSQSYLILQVGLGYYSLFQTLLGIYYLLLKCV